MGRQIKRLISCQLIKYDRSDILAESNTQTQVSDYIFWNKYLQCKLAERKFDINILKTKIIFVKNELLCISVIKTNQYSTLNIICQ